MFNFKRLLVNLKNEILVYKLTYFLLTVILVGGLFVRVYRIDQTLGFYFDQGRDAKVIWDFWYQGKMFLIGPTTGIAGIFRGPFYYYLIAPFYLIGGGNPIYPSIFLSLTTVIAILIMYIVSARHFSRPAGLIAATIASFSFNMVFSSKWLSNPTPMMLLSMVLVTCLFWVYEGKRWAWIAMALTAGSSLFHFGSAGEVFYFPAILIIFLWIYWKNNWDWEKTIGWKYLGLAVFSFLLTFAPLALFDLRHEGILRKNIFDFLFTKGSFKTNFWDVFKLRMAFYLDVFGNKIYHWRTPLQTSLIWVVLGSLIIIFSRLWKNDYFKILVILLASPIVGLLFFQGNFGNIYDYYLTGYYLIFILIFSIVMGEMWKSSVGKAFVLLFIFILLRDDGHVVRGVISTGVDGPETILFGNQKQAIEWIYKDAMDQEFNVDVYVPPVIPHAYDYLFIWYTSKKEYQVSGGARQVMNQVPLLYTLYEVDVPHPERLTEWMQRQAGIGEVIYKQSFGGITVERRMRLK